MREKLRNYVMRLLKGSHSRLYLIFALLSVAYLVITIVTPADATTLQRYNLTETQAEILGLTVLVPYIIIWFIAIHGSIRLKNYAEFIKKSKDGKALVKVSNGLALLALLLPLSAILGATVSLVAVRKPELLNELSVAVNYIVLIGYLFVFWLIYKGCQGLVKSTGKYSGLRPRPIPGLALIVVSNLFAFLTLTNPARQFPSIESSGRAAYYLPDPLLFFTIIIPYIFVWCLGIKSVENISQYQTSVQGSIYKKALKLLAVGLLLTVISSMALRFLTSLTTVFNDTSLPFLLLILYLLLILIASGYVLIAVGVRRLRKIEEA